MIVATSNIFHADLFVAASAAIPVLWVTIGLATNTLVAIFKTMQSLNATIDYGFPGVTYTLDPTGISISVRGIGTINIAGPGSSTIFTAYFVTFLVLGGALGEVVSFWALLDRSSSAWMGVVVFVCVCVLVALTALTLVVSLATAASEARRPGPTDPSTSHGTGKTEEPELPPAS